VGDGKIPVKRWGITKRGDPLKRVGICRIDEKK